MNNNEYLGRCFFASFETMRKEIPTATLVHGIITNPSGKKIVHAWIELKVDYVEWVFDPSVMERGLRTDFYRAYKVDEVFKYGMAKALVLRNDSESYGPWEPKLVAHQFFDGDAKVRTATRRSREFNKEMLQKWREENGQT